MRTFYIVEDKDLQTRADKVISDNDLNAVAVYADPDWRGEAEHQGDEDVIELIDKALENDEGEE